MIKGGKLNSRVGPTFELFNTSDSAVPLNGVSKLPAELTINGVTKTPDWRIRGYDATADSWPAWGYGATAFATGSGNTVSGSYGVPLLGTEDDSMKYNGGKCHQMASAATLDYTTQDLVYELVCQVSPTANVALIDKA